MEQRKDPALTKNTSVMKMDDVPSVWKTPIVLVLVIDVLISNYIQDLTSEYWLI